MVKPAYVASSADDPLPWRLVAKEAGGGLVMDVGCHTIDICDFIVGPLHNVAGCATQSAGAPYAVEDGVAFTARFSGSTGHVGADADADADAGAGACAGAGAGAGVGVGAGADTSNARSINSGNDAIATMSWCFVGPSTTSRHNEDEIVVRGTRGELRLSTFGSEPVRVSVADPVTGELHVTTHDFPRPDHVHQPLVQTIVDELRGVARKPRCPSRGDNAVRVAEVLDAVLARYYGGRADAFWDREETWPRASSQPPAPLANNTGDVDGMPPLIRTPPGMYVVPTLFAFACEGTSVCVPARGCALLRVCLSGVGAGYVGGWLGGGTVEMVGGWVCGWVGGWAVGWAGGWMGRWMGGREGGMVGGWVSWCVGA
jgi:hypothetical protein